MRLLLALLLSLLALPAMAGEFETKVEGIIAHGKIKKAGAKISVAMDPLWGLSNQSGFEQFKKKWSKLPTVTVTGETTSVEEGKFELAVKVSWKGEGKIPTTLVWVGNNQEKRYVISLVCTLSADGFSTSTTRFYIKQIDSNLQYLYMFKDTVISGRVVDKTDGSPAANLNISVMYDVKSQQGEGPSRGKITEEVKTDASGYFEVTNKILKGSVTLRVLDVGFAFTHDSPAWEPNVKWQENNHLGTLEVVAGGMLSVTIAHGYVRNKPIFWAALISKDVEVEGSKFDINFLVQKDAKILQFGLPSGEYILHLGYAGTWSPGSIELTIAKGKSTDLGDVIVSGAKRFSVFLTGPDAEDYRHIVTATFLGEAKPFGRRHSKQNPFKVVKEIHPTRPKIGVLFAGEWKIEVETQRYAYNSTTVSIPRDDSVSIELERASTFRCYLGGDSSDLVDDIFAVRAGSKAAENIDSFDESYLEKVGRSKNSLPEGLFSSDGNAVIRRLPSGKYTILALNPLGGIAKKTDVVVAPGSNTRLKLEAVPSYLNISISFKNRPLSNTVFYVLTGKHLLDDFEGEKCKTDANGKYSYRIRRNKDTWILREVEYQWIMSVGVVQWNLSGQFSKMGFKAWVGQPQDIDVNFSARSRSVVRVKLKTYAGQKVNHVTLCFIEGARREYYRALGGRVADEWVCIGVDSGDYDVVVEFEANGSKKILNSRVQTSKEPDQTYEVDVKLLSLRVKVKIGKGIDPDRVRVTVLPGNYSPIWQEDSMFGNKMLDDSYSCVFSDLFAGTFQVLASVQGDPKHDGFAARITIDLKSNKTVTITLASDVGVYCFRIWTENDDIYPLGLFCTVVRFYDTDGKLVLPADPLAGVLSHDFGSNGFRVVSIPIGTYTITISSGGCLPVKLKNVKIEKGGDQFYDVDLRDAGQMQVSLKNFKLEKRMTASYRFEDSNGNELKNYGPVGNSVVLQYRNGGPQAKIYNLSKAVGKVWIKIPGYKPFYVKNTSKNGSTTKVSQECVPADE